MRLQLHQSHGDEKMKELVQDLIKSKTFWLCVVWVLGVLEQAMTHQISLRQGVAAAFPALVALTMRHAIEKTKEPEKKPDAKPPTV
jgi:hypothetical protein